MYISLNKNFTYILKYFCTWRIFFLFLKRFFNYLCVDT